MLDFVLAPLLIAAVSNLDNLAVGFGLGMRGTRIAAAPNAVIAAITMAGTAGAMTSGRILSEILSSSSASALGASIVIAIGAWTLLVSLAALLHPVSEAPTTRPIRVLNRALTRDLPGRDTISWREAVVLGVALSLNNVGAGLGAGVAGVSPLATTLLAGMLSLLWVGGGSRVGRTLAAAAVGRWAPLVSGLLLLGVGIAISPGVS